MSAQIPNVKTAFTSHDCDWCTAVVIKQDPGLLLLGATICLQPQRVFIVSGGDFNASWLWNDVCSSAPSHHLLQDRGGRGPGDNWECFSIMCLALINPEYSQVQPLTTLHQQPLPGRPLSNTGQSEYTCHVALSNTEHTWHVTRGCVQTRARVIVRWCQLTPGTIPPSPPSIVFCKRSVKNPVIVAARADFGTAGRNLL